MTANTASRIEERSALHIAVLDPFYRRDDQPGSARTHDLVRRLAAAGHTVSVLTTSAALKADGSLPADGITISDVHVNVRARFGYPAAAPVLQAFARGVFWRLWGLKDVDAVLAADRPLRILPMLMIFCLLRGIPLLIEARAGLPEKPDARAELAQRLRAQLARGLFRVCAAFAKRIVAVSADMKRALYTEGINDAKILASAPGCDTTLFAAQPGASTPALTAYPHLAEGLLLVYAGAFAPERGLENMIDLAAEVYATAPDINFALCGDGPTRGKLEARAQERGVLNKNVWFLEPLARRDLPRLFNAAAAAVVGGAPDLAFDALAASRPVVLTTDGDIKDLIESRGAGIGLPVHDTKAAARELLDFLKDPDGLRRAGHQALALAAGRFNIDRVAGEVRTAIEDAVAADPRHAVLRRRTLRAKRVFDIVVSLAALIVLSPVFLAMAIAVAVKLGWPVFFTQSRTGLRGKIFRIVKFRSMTEAKDLAGNLLPDADRLTPFGQFLRRTSLDELPELFNVLKGDMSLVGPRPLLPEYLPYYTPEQRRRHDIAPGLTGWSQVNGRNALTWEDKFVLDTWYVENLGLWLDIKILLRTLWIAVTGQGVNAEGHATMPRFDEIMARRQGAEDV